MEVIPLEDIKTHFKIYPRAFRAETAISAMSTHLSFTVAEAKECLGGILFAGLILNADKPTTSTSAAEVLDYKPKTIYSLSAKGALVLRDFDEKRTVSTENLTPEKVYGAADALPLQTHVIYVDRDADGAYIKADTTLDVVFKSAFGVQTPNLTKPDPVNLFPSDELVSTSPSTPPTPIEPLFLKDKVHRLKQYSHAFTGSALVDWVLRNTSVVARIEGIAIASAFVTRGLITCINADDTAAGSASDKFRDNIRAVYVPTFAAARLLAWDAAPGVTGAVHGFFAGSKKKSDDHRSSGAGQGKGEGSERVSVGGSEGRKSETSVSENS
ncbi:hypothetical protein HK100_004658 [Physocladia obscura]|uniref:DEP domain-containing protein n=1 Tax=Physocladia obscura TaxID=109957 RepID=A0AAD5XDR0_9FUNG|nr:hypothetical protein HK100_004658 [Physocladia obscura]